MKTKIDNIEILSGDITSLDVDIIVNAANKTLLGGAGVDGAIHYKAGPELLEECKTLNGCETGEAKITKAYKLPCKRIIHTVGPMFHSNPDKAPQLLKNCYLNSMKLAEQYRMENNLDKISIAFPCISTGIYGYPKDEACKLAIDTIKEINNPNIEVKFVCFGELDYKLYLNKLNGIDKGVFELDD